MEKTLLQYRMHSANTIKEDHGAVRLEWAAAAASYLDAILAGSGPVEWAKLAEFTAVLERHRLLRGVQLCLAHLRRHPGGMGLQHGAMLAEPAFRVALQGCV